MRKRDPKQLLQYKSVQSWLEGLKPEYSKHNLEFFIKFVDFTGMNPDQMLEQRKLDLKSDDMKEKRRFEQLARKFYDKMLEYYTQKGKSDWHAFNHMKAVMSFFSRNFTELKFKRKELKLPKKKLKRTGLTIGKLKEGYEILDPRGRAIFVTLLQSGLSPIDVCSLNIEQIIENLDAPPDYIEGYRSKTDVGYQTALGEDSCIAIKKYLLLRGNPTEGALFLSRTGERYNETEFDWWKS